MNPKKHAHRKQQNLDKGESADGCHASLFYNINNPGESVGCIGSLPGIQDACERWCHYRPNHAIIFAAYVRVYTSDPTLSLFTADRMARR